MSDGEMVVEPPTFVPTMVSVCEPSAPRAKFCNDQMPFATVAAVPLTVTDVAVPLPPERFTVLELTNDPGAGSVSESVGGGTVMTETFALAGRVTAAVATAGSGTRHAGPRRARGCGGGGAEAVGSGGAWYVPSAAMVAACPLTLTVSGLMSLTVPVTTTWLGSPTTELSAGEVMAICGSCVSMLTVTVMGLWLPALSTASRVTVCPAPSVVTVASAGQVAMPLSASLQVKLTVTAALFQPAAFGAGVTVPVIVGGVRSTVSDGAIGVEPPAFVPTMFNVCGPSGPRL